MKKNHLIENILKRNAVLHSAGPIDARFAKEHFDCLVHQVETTGRVYDLVRRGRIVGRLQGPPQVANANA